MKRSAWNKSSTQRCLASTISATCFKNTPVQASPLKRTVSIHGSALAHATATLGLKLERVVVGSSLHGQQSDHRASLVGLDL
eukprot:1014416-Amphidinium_carterae.1